MDRFVRLASITRNGGILELPSARVLTRIGVAAVLAAGGAWGFLHRRPAPIPVSIVPGDSGSGFLVEVLNGTAVDGLARDVARRLRKRGIDVVYFGSSGSRRDLDSTIIMIRRGDSTAAVAVRKALGTGRITVELDAQRLLDASVVVGRDVAPAVDRHP